MNPDETTERNEKIARFMGLVRFDENRHYALPQWYKQDPEDARKKGKFMGYPDQLQYHEKWDWLMPVVEKIHTLPEFFTVNIGSLTMSNLGMLSHVQYCIITDSRKMPRGECTGAATLHEAVYEAVSQFIDWFNEQKKV